MGAYILIHTVGLNLHAFWRCMRIETDSNSTRHKPRACCLRENFSIWVLDMHVQHYDHSTDISVRVQVFQWCTSYDNFFKMNMIQRAIIFLFFIFVLYSYFFFFFFFLIFFASLFLFFLDHLISSIFDQRSAGSSQSVGIYLDMVNIRWLQVFVIFCSWHSQHFSVLFTHSLVYVETNLAVNIVGLFLRGCMLGRGLFWKWII